MATAAECERIVEENLDLVERLVCRSRLTRPGLMSDDDVRSAAQERLYIYLIDKFDPKKGTPFRNYAKRVLGTTIPEELRSQDWLPRQERRHGKTYARAKSELRARLDREPTIEEIAEHLDVPCKTAEKFERAYHHPIMHQEDPAVDVSNSNERFVVPLANTCSSEEQNPTFDLVVLRDEINLDVLAKILTPDECRVIELKYYYGMDHVEIARAMGPRAYAGRVACLTNSRICQIHTKAMKKLKAHFTAKEE